MSNTPTLAQLQRGLQISQQIAALETELKAIFSGKAVSKPANVVAPKPAALKKRKGRMSAQGRANIVAAQKARWAKIKAAGKKGKAKAAPKASPKANSKASKRKPMSAAAKARLAALMKARWAAAKAGTGPAPTARKN